MGVRRRRRRHRGAVDAAVRARRILPEAQVHQPRHGGVQGPRPHHRGLHPDPRPARVPRSGGGDRAAGLPAGRPGGDDPAAGVERGAAGARRGGDQGPGREGRQPADGAGRGVPARLAAGHLGHQTGVRHQLQAGVGVRTASGPDRERPGRRRRAQPVRCRLLVAAGWTPRRPVGQRVRDAAGDGAGPSRGGAPRGRRAAAVHPRRRPRGVRRGHRLPDPTAGGGSLQRELHVGRLRTGRQRGTVRPGGRPVPGGRRRSRRAGAPDAQGGRPVCRRPAERARRVPQHPGHGPVGGRQPGRRRRGAGAGPGLPAGRRHHRRRAAGDAGRARRRVGGCALRRPGLGDASRRRTRRDPAPGGRGSGEPSGRLPGGDGLRGGQDDRPGRP